MFFILCECMDLFGGLIGCLPLILILYSLFGCNKSRRKTVLLILLVLYLSIMFLVVGIPALESWEWHPNGSLIPFRDHYIRSYRFQTGMNILMFVPLGILLPLIWKRFRNPVRTVLAGAVTSLIIEVLQMFCKRATDVDDLIMNTVGTLVGVLFAWICCARRWRKEERNGKRQKRRELAEYLLVLLICLLSNILIRSYVGIWFYRLLNL